jgi:hypothetical protein
VSQGIIQTAIRNKRVPLELEVREPSEPLGQIPSELPTLADLILPGMDYPGSEEFQCLLGLLIARGERT